MTNPRVLNPDSTILQQVDGQWQKLLTMLLFKLKGTEHVEITAADMEAFSKAFEPGIPTLATIGRHDAICFQLVTSEQAAVMVAHDRAMRGRA